MARRRLLRDLRPQLRRLERRRRRRPPRDHATPAVPARARRRRALADAVLPVARRRPRLRRRRLRRRRPAVRHARRLRRARSPRAHELGPARDRRHRPEPHARTSTRGSPATARATSRAPAGRRPAEQLAVELRRPGVDARRGARTSTTSTSSRPSSPTSTGTTRRCATTSTRSSASGSTAASTASASTSRTRSSRTRRSPTSRSRSPSRRFSSDWRTAIDQPEVHDVYRDWRRLADSYDGDRVLVGEVVFSDQTRVAPYLRPDELQLAFNFSLVFQDVGRGRDPRVDRRRRSRRCRS